MDQPESPPKTNDDGGHSWWTRIKQAGKDAAIPLLVGFVLLAAPEVVKFLSGYFGAAGSRLVYMYETTRESKSGTVLLVVRNTGRRSLKYVQVWINGMPRDWKVIYDNHGFPAERLRACGGSRKDEPSVQTPSGLRLASTAASSDFCAEIESFPAGASVDFAAIIALSNAQVGIGDLESGLEIGVTMRRGDQEIVGTHVILSEIVKQNRRLNIHRIGMWPLVGIICILTFVLTRRLKR